MPTYLIHKSIVQTYQMHKYYYYLLLFGFVRLLTLRPLLAYCARLW
jgi:hypothetical protein